MNDMSQGDCPATVADGSCAPPRRDGLGSTLAAVDQLRLVQHLSHLGMWTYDPARQTISWSEEARLLLGEAASLTHLDLQRFLKRVYRDDRATLDAAFRSLTTATQDLDLCVRYDAGDAVLMTLHIRGLRASCADGRSNGLWFGTVAQAEPLAAVRPASRHEAGEETGDMRRRWLPVRKTVRRALVTARDEEELAAIICDVLVRGASYLAAVVLIQETDDSLRILGRSAGCDQCQRLPGANLDGAKLSALLGALIDNGEPKVLPLADGDGPAPELGPHCPRASTVALLPIGHARSGPVGVLMIWGSQPYRLGGMRLDDLADLADDLAFGLMVLRDRQNQIRSAMRLERSMEQTVSALAATIEKRDPYTAGHQRRVATIASQIACSLGLPQDLVHGIELAANIHDIGKIYVPSEILSRPGRLSPAEFHLIQDHCQVGYEIVKDIDLQWNVAEMLLQHHERLDGSGYPHGLKDDAILFGAHIIGVADTVEAMASHRPYRPGLGVARAVAEVREGAGERYDGRVVAACLSLFDAGTLTLDAPP